MMDGKLAVETILQKFATLGHQITIPLQRGGSFKANMVHEGIMVTNLGNQPLLPWIVFEETINLLTQQNGRAKRGNAMDYKLGEEGLSLDSIEGHIAYKVYGRKIGDSVFRRISAISAILVWCGICNYEPGELVLC